MHVTCEKFIRPGWFIHSFDPPHLAGIFLAKVTVKLMPDAVAELLAEDDSVPLSGDVHQGDDPKKPLWIASDFVPFKPRVDLLLKAVAHAPGQQPSKEWTVRWRVGDWSKALKVFGNRRWEMDVLTTRATEPEPTLKVALSYNNALGNASYAKNPAGKGLGIDAKELPNIEDPNAPIRSPRDTLSPAGFLPIHATWEPRTTFLGTYDEDWKRSRWPWFPKDFDYSYFNVAPPDQQLKHSLAGDEELFFENMHPIYPRLRTHLPKLRIRCFVSERAELTQESDWVEVPLHCDTLQVDLEKGIATLLWRGSRVVQSFKMRELQHVIMIAESTSDNPMTSKECFAKYVALQALAPAEDELDPESEQDSLQRQQEFEQTMDAIEEEHLLVMQQADQQEAEARERAIAEGLSPEAFDSQTGGSWADLHNALTQMANEARVSKPAIVSDIEAEIKDLENLQRLDAELNAQSDELTREDVERMAAQQVSFEDVSLADLELYDLNFAGLNFTNADFTEAMLDGANFRGANLSNANFSQADLTDANLEGACLDGADFSDAVLEGCSFKGASIAGTNFSGLDLKQCDFSECCGFDADFSDANLDHAIFRKSQLPQSNFQGASLVEATFESANLQSARFEKAKANRIQMMQADITELHASDTADFTQANFTQCKGAGSIWEESILDEAVFIEADLERALFASASIVKGQFDRSNLKNCVFDDADLQNASLDQCNLMSASFDRATLTNASMRESNIYQSGFWNARLDGVLLDGTSLTGTALKHD